jgi:hypothetical protein
MEEKNKTYTAADFARYHAGTMPPGEMHALEKAALEDPFLEDALEGYKQSSAVESEIEELKARLGEKRKKKNVFFISSVAQNKWWRVAAILVIIAASGYFFYRLNSANKENLLVENKTKSPAEKKDSVVALKSEIETSKADTVSKNNNIALERRSGGKLPNPTSPAPTASLYETKRQIKKKAVVPEQKMESVTVPGYAMKSRKNFSADSSYAKQGNKETDTLAANEYVLKGIVTDEVGGPVPFANITAKASKNGTIADANGLFFLRSKDSSITVTAVAAGFEAKTFRLKKDMQPTIAMNRNKEELTSVIVTTTRSKKGKTDLSQPSRGREKFDQYLKENTPPVYDENNKLLTGEVLLSFTINKKGRPRNIKVLKSSCEACEEKAIELLENGPDWIVKKGTPGTVVIKF